MIRKSFLYIKSLVNSIAKPARVFGKPIHLQLEPTTYCNLSCPQCPRDSYIETPRNMGFDQFCHIINLIRPTHLTLSGLGEPTINNDLFEMIGYARKKKINVNTTSNFISITQESMHELIRSKLNLLNVSVDAATRETYLKVRSRDSFDRVKNNIALFVQGRRSYGTKEPFLRLAFVVQGNNFNEMLEFFEFAKSMEADAVLYQVFSDSAMETKKYLAEGIRMHDLEKRLDELLMIERGYRKPSTNAAYLKDQLQAIRKIYMGQTVNLVRRCIKPWISVYITVDGDVKPCCSFGARKITMGNIFEVKYIDEIFNTEEYRNFRDKLRTGKIPDSICTRCIPESPFDIYKRIRWTPNFIRRVT